MIKTIPYHSAVKIFITNLASIEKAEQEKVRLVLPRFAVFPSGKHGHDVCLAERSLMLKHCEDIPQQERTMMNLGEIHPAVLKFLMDFSKAFNKNYMSVLEVVLYW